MIYHRDSEIAGKVAVTVGTGMPNLNAYAKLKARNDLILVVFSFL